MTFLVPRVVKKPLLTIFRLILAPANCNDGASVCSSLPPRLKPGYNQKWYAYLDRDR